MKVVYHHSDHSCGWSHVASKQVWSLSEIPPVYYIHPLLSLEPTFLIF